MAHDVFLAEQEGGPDIDAERSIDSRRRHGTDVVALGLAMRRVVDKNVDRSKRDLRPVEQGAGGIGAAEIELQRCRGTAIADDRLDHLVGRSGPLPVIEGKARFRRRLALGRHLQICQGNLGPAPSEGPRRLGADADWVVRPGDENSLALQVHSAARMTGIWLQNSRPGATAPLRRADFAAQYASSRIDLLTRTRDTARMPRQRPSRSGRSQLPTIRARRTPPCRAIADS